MILSRTAQVQKVVQKLVLKMRRNERNIRLHIISVYPIFETIRKKAWGMQMCINS